jgi:hypothetical protein
MHAFGKCGAPDQMRGVRAAFGLVYLEADDLAAIKIQDQVQVEPQPLDRGRQPRDIPAPHRAGAIGRVRRGQAPHRRSSTSSMARLPVLAKDAVEGRFAADVGSRISQHRHDARRRHVGKARLVGGGQDRIALLGAQRMCRRRAFDQRTPVADDQAFVGLPALQGAQLDASFLASRFEPCAGGVRLVDQGMTFRRSSSRIIRPRPRGRSPPFFFAVRAAPPPPPAPSPCA